MTFEIPNKMKAAVVEVHGQPLVVKEVDTPKPGFGEVGIYRLISFPI